MIASARPGFDSQPVHHPVINDIEEIEDDEQFLTIWFNRDIGDCAIWYKPPVWAGGVYIRSERVGQAETLIEACAMARKHRGMEKQ